jgi:hypothetical protein
MTTPDYPRTLGNKGKLTNIYGEKKTFEVIGEISCWQGKLRNKRIYLQQIRHNDDNRLEYRFTYYMKGEKPGPTRDRWVYGQYSLMIPEPELAYLLKEAKTAAWPGF